MAEMLVRYGSDVNARDGAKRTALCLAVSEGHFQIASLLLNQGADVNLIDREGYTALHNVYINLHTFLGNERMTFAMTKLLFEFGSKVGDIDPQGRTELHMAAQSSSVKLVQQLLDYGSKVNAIDIEGCTPLMRAIKFSRRPDLVVRLLLDNDANIAVKDKLGRSALHYSAGLKGNRKISQVLIHKGADIHAVDIHGNTALHLAANNRNTHTAELLLQNGCDITTCNKRKESVIHKAITAKCECTHGCRKCVWKYHTVALLVEKGCDVKKTDIDGNSALHLMAEWITDPTTVRLLLRNGADVRARNNQGSTPLHLICAVKCERSRAK